MDQRRNHNELENTLRLIKIKTQHAKTYEVQCKERTFIAVNIYIKKEERSQINNLNFCLKEVEKNEQTKVK